MSSEFILKPGLKKWFVAIKQRGMTIDMAFFVFITGILLRVGNGRDVDISRFERRFYSQNGEDGILYAIFCKIGTTNKFFVEFGVGDGKQCNTRFLRQSLGWRGLMMDSDVESCELIEKEFVTAESVNDLFHKYRVPDRFDLLSIDVDGNDYWIWKALDPLYAPRVVVIEYNASIPPTERKVIEYEPRFKWDGTDYFGASLPALVQLAASKGYTLLGCDKMGVNAFFLRNEEMEKHFAGKDITELFRPPKYGKAIDGFGHPKSERSMKEI